MPVLWTRPDGGVSVTVIAHEVLERERLRTVIMPTGELRTDAAGTIAAAFKDYRDGLKNGEVPAPLTVISEEATADAVLRIARAMIQPKTPALAGLAPLLVTTAQVPTSRRFRNCWRPNGAGLGVDMPTARAQRMDEIRAERDRRLAATDGEMLREQEQGSPRATPLAAHRQALRDLPPAAATTLDVVITPEGLDAYQPPWPVKPP